jgi:hypothetical protein
MLLRKMTAGVVVCMLGSFVLAANSSYQKPVIGKGFTENWSTGKIDPNRWYVLKK